MLTNVLPSGIEIVAQEMETSNASVDFDMSFNEYMNVTPWPSDKNFTRNIGAVSCIYWWNSTEKQFRYDNSYYLEDMGFNCTKDAHIENKSGVASFVQADGIYDCVCSRYIYIGELWTMNKI